MASPFAISMNEFPRDIPPPPYSPPNTSPSVVPSPIPPPYYLQRETNFNRIRPAGWKKMSLAFFCFILLIATCIGCTWAAFKETLNRGSIVGIFSVNFQSAGLLLGVTGVLTIVTICLLMLCIFHITFDRMRIFCHGAFVLALSCLAILSTVLARGNMDVSFEKDVSTIVFHRYNTNDNETTPELDMVQKSMQCCGAWNYSDWLKNPYTHCIIDKEHNCNVPRSCCKDVDYGKIEFPGYFEVKEGQLLNSTNKNCGVGLLNPIMPEWIDKKVKLEDKIYTEGCIPKLEEAKNNSAILIIIYSIVILLAQVNAVALTILITMWIKKNTRLRLEANIEMYNLSVVPYPRPTRGRHNSVL